MKIEYKTVLEKLDTEIKYVEFTDVKFKEGQLSIDGYEKYFIEQILKEYLSENGVDAKIVFKWIQQKDYSYTVKAMFRV